MQEQQKNVQCIKTNSRCNHRKRYNPTPPLRRRTTIKKSQTSGHPTPRKSIRKSLLTKLSAKEERRQPSTGRRIGARFASPTRNNQRETPSHDLILRTKPQKLIESSMRRSRKSKRERRSSTWKNSKVYKLHLLITQRDAAWCRPRGK